MTDEVYKADLVARRNGDDGSVRMSFHDNLNGLHAFDLSAAEARSLAALLDPGREAVEAERDMLRERLREANEHHTHHHEYDVKRGEDFRALTASVAALSAKLEEVTSKARAFLASWNSEAHCDAHLAAAESDLVAALALPPSEAIDAVRMRDAVALYDGRAAWSERTFGPGDKYQGVVEHIRRELAEIERDSADLEEWVDVVMLAMDGAYRSAKADGATFWAAFRAKAAKNEARRWSPPDAQGVSEHDRSADLPSIVKAAGKR